MPWLGGLIAVWVFKRRQRAGDFGYADHLSAALPDQSDLPALVAGRPAHLPRFLAAKYQPDPGLIDD